jgi:hypothetical protein
MLVTALAFSVLDAVAERNAASPTIRFQMRARSGDEPIDALALRVRLQIEPWRRRYDGAERELIAELSVTKPLQLAEVAVMIGAFSGESAFALPVSCTYDVQVASMKYFSALHDGEVPLRFFFNGTIFRGGEAGFQVEMVPWDLECTASLPLATWQAAMDACFPNQAWIRIERATFDELLRYRAQHALNDWEAVVTHLLAARVTEPR